MKGTAHQSQKLFNLHNPVGQTAGTVNGTGIDTRGFEEALIVLAVGTVPSNGTVNAKIQESSDNTTFADITDVAFTEVDADNDALSYVGRINLRGRKRYLRSVVVVANQTTPLYVGAILSQAKTEPVSQINTVAFDV
jgi:hypothetical protein